MFLAIGCAVLLSVSAGPAPAPVPFTTLPFTGMLPYQVPSGRTADLFNDSDEVSQQILAASRQPYDLLWVEHFVSDEVRSTLIHLHQELLQVMSESLIESVRITRGKDSVSAEVVYRLDSGEPVTIRSIWREDGDGVYRIFSLDEK